LQVTLESSTPYGWPQIVVAVYGLNLFGNDMLVGYGATHIPTTAGAHEIDIPLFAPAPQSVFQKISAWFTGLAPELVDVDSVATGEFRECLHTCSQGSVRLALTVVINDTESLDLNLEP
jgi:B9 domain-containing protein 1